MLRFEHTGYLLLLLLIPLLALLYKTEQQWKRRTIVKIGDESLVKRLIQDFSPQKHKLKFSIIVLALFCLIIGTANLQSATQAEIISRQGIDVVIALDVSNSMLATDVAPNRLEKAKLFINRLISQLGNDRIGLVIFAGSAYLQMPLTTDANAAALFVNSSAPEMAPVQGTVIANALEMANSAFDMEDEKYKAVILITDGEDHENNALSMARQLSEQGVVIHTIGAGTTGGATIPNPTTGENMRDVNNDIVVSRLNENLLTEIATEANGIYQPLSDVEAVTNNIRDQLNRMDQKMIRDNRSINYRSFFQWFLFLAFAALTYELFVSEKKKIPKA